MDTAKRGSGGVNEVVTSYQAARGALRGAIARAQYTGGRTVITMYGRPCAAICSLEDLAALEQETSAPAVATPETA